MHRTVSAPISLLALSLAGCADLPAPSPAPPRARLELELGFFSREPTCIEVALGDARPSEVCATPVDGRATFVAEAECDPSAGSVRARISLAALGEIHPGDALYEPCGAEGCTFDVDCGNGPTHALLELALRRYREFSPVSVATSSGWFYGGAATCTESDEGSHDEPFVLRWADGEHRTALLYYTAARGFDEAAPAVIASTPVLACGAVTCPLPYVADETASALCSDGANVRYRTLSGMQEDFLSARYLGLLIDVDSIAAAGLTGCQVNAATTFVAPSLVDLDRADAFPVARYHLPLLDDDGELVCAKAGLDAYEVDDDVVTIEFLRGWNLRPLGELGFALPPLCHTLDDEGLSSDCD